MVHKKKVPFFKSVMRMSGLVKEKGNGKCFSAFMIVDVNYNMYILREIATTSHLSLMQQCILDKWCTVGLNMYETLKKMLTQAEHIFDTF